MPAQKPGKSKQDYGTPRVLVGALELKLGREVTFDLAASPHNAKHERYFTEADNSLQQDWHKIGGLLWLNPPFANLAPWAEKCKTESAKGAEIAMLTPASVGSEWFAEHCYERCRVILLRPRLTFEGMEQNPRTGKVDPYPKDCMITVWGPGIVAGFELWRWTL